MDYGTLRILPLLMMVVSAAGAQAGDAAGLNKDPMALVPAGEFLMGARQGTQAELPVRKVRLDAYYIDRYETSAREYEAFQPSRARSDRSACDECPVTLVNWMEADAYCKSRGARLPTEAEWERAARGPEGNDYSFGRQPDKTKARFGEPFAAGAVPVNAHEPNGFGIYNMSGNVWEWVGDWFAPYPKGPSVNPLGPASGSERVLRGGSWYNAEYYINAGMRFHLDPAARLNSLGFRCAVSAKERAGK
ncbi:MAG: SUMF1/EgtB/PvdO family nonheme iron enzyme [Nitrospinae bacterium]|nr:SUMF1/EgtB/PvdO family nonheme iron enzyme [Nitrospinota bacterium]